MRCGNELTLTSVAQTTQPGGHGEEVSKAGPACFSTGVFYSVRQWGPGGGGHQVESVYAVRVSIQSLDLSLFSVATASLLCN